MTGPEMLLRAMGIDPAKLFEQITTQLAERGIRPEAIIAEWHEFNARMARIEAKLDDLLGKRFSDDGSVATIPALANGAGNAAQAGGIGTVGDNTQQED